MGLVFRDVTTSPTVIIERKVAELSTANANFLKSLGFSVKHVGHRKRR